VRSESFRAFVGRRRELAEVTRLLGTFRLVTLTGVAGVGKSTLAAQVAAELGAGYRHGGRLIDLAAVPAPALLTDTVASALQIRDNSARSPLAILRDHLAGKELLLVLDNCERMPAECAALIGELLAVAPGLRILATGRRAFGLAGEHPLEVPPLSPRESVELWHARRGGPADDAAGEICRRLGGVPLAIELAARWWPSLPVRRLLDLLDQRHQALTAGRAPEEALRAAIDFSFALCTPAQRRLWARCSILAGDGDVEALAAVCADREVSPSEIIEATDVLVAASVLTVDQGGPRTRYRLGNTLAHDGLARLRGIGEEERLRRRHRDHYQRLAATAMRSMFGPGHLDWLARLRREHPNLRLALEHCREHDPVRGLRLAADLRFHWVTSVHLAEGRGWLDRLLALAPEPTPARADALWVASWLALTQGDVPGARAMLAECRALAPRLGAVAAMGYGALFSGQIAMSDGDRRGALACYQEALRHLRMAEDRDGMVITLNRLALAYSALDRPGAAAAAGAESRALCESGGDEAHNSYALWVLGIVAWREGDLATAEALERESLRIRRRMRDLPGLALTLEALTWIAASERRYEDAAALFGVDRTLRGMVGGQLAGWGDLVRHHDESDARTRRELGDARYRAALEYGAGLSLDQATMYAPSPGRRMLPA
jgi:predicted ATPase